MIKETSAQPPFAATEALGKQPSVPGLEGFVRLSPDADKVAETLGPLADLVGKWIGSKGWNMIAVPQGDNFLLLIRPFIETVTFIPLGAPVPDRGGEAGTLMLMALEYNLHIVDAITNQPMHFENGMWLLLDQDPNPQPDQLTLARHSVIPHGDSLMALGNYTITKGAPQISDRSGMPDAGNPPLGYLDPYLSNPEKSFNPGNVTLTLQETLQAQEAAGQNVLQTTTINVNTANDGGGLLNIPFIVQHANATAFESVFWIETVQSGDTTFQQLQYFQQTNLEFLPKFGEPGLIMWPHVNVNTLSKQ